MTTLKAHSSWVRRSSAVLTTTLGLVAALVLVPAPTAHADDFTGPFPATPGTLGAIPDSSDPNCGTSFGSRTVSVPVSGLPTTRRLTDVYVGLNINHTYVSDLIIDLVPPGSSYPSGSNFVRLFGSLNCTPNSSADLNGGYGFQTGQGSFASAIAAAGSGTVAPGNYAPQDPMSRFNGIFNPNGTWQIVFYDADLGATGSVNGAELRFKQDTTAPSVSFTGSSPADNATVKANPTYSFSSPDSDLSRFECSVDGGAFSTCTSPRTLNQGLGVHTFKVRAIDTSGNVSAVISRQYNQIPDPPPETEITSGPADGSTVSTPPSFVFGSPDLDISQFECRLDGGAWSTCVSPQSEPATGSHLFEVRAVDQAGQPDGTPAARSYTYTPDVTAPETQISSGPADGALLKTPPTYGFASPDADAAGFQCSVDGGAFTGCASPFQLSVFAPGEHTFIVRAYDEVPNFDSSPAARTFILRDLCQEAKDKLAAAKAKLQSAIDHHASKAKIHRLRNRVHQLRIQKNQACS